jgi:hypothetical protein
LAVEAAYGKPAVKRGFYHVFGLSGIEQFA